MSIYSGSSEESRLAATGVSRQVTAVLRKNHCPVPGGDCPVVFLGSRLSRMVQYSAAKIRPDEWDGEAIRMPTWEECEWPFPGERVLFTFENPVYLEFLISSQSTRVQRKEIDWKIPEPEFDMMPVSGIYLLPKSQVPPDADRHSREMLERYRNRGGDEICFAYYVHPDNKGVSNAVWAFGSVEHIHPSQKRLSTNVKFQVALMRTLKQVGLQRPEPDGLSDLYALDINPGSAGIWGMGKSSPVR